MNVKDMNFSIVVPGSCNAKCSFCSWRENSQGQVKAISKRDYIRALGKALEGYINNGGTQVSITGGEPTISESFKDVLECVRYSHPDKVVLTSNGAGLGKHFGHFSDIIKTVDHVNLSRHHFVSDISMKAFGLSRSRNNGIPCLDREISALVEDYDAEGIDFTANCVVTDEVKKEFIVKYLKWARSMGFYRVAFRKQAGNLDDLPVESQFSSYRVLDESYCPVCASRTQLIKGVEVWWKKSVKDPGEEMTKPFEFVFQPDGKLYYDWAFKRPVKRSSKSSRKSSRKPKRFSKPNQASQSSQTLSTSSLSASGFDGCRAVTKTSCTAFVGGGCNPSRGCH